MSDLSRLEGEAWDRGYACGKLEAADRIEALEAAKAEAAQTCNSYLDRALKAEARIEALEAALRAIADKRKMDAVAAVSMQAIARAALAPEQEK